MKKHHWFVAGSALLFAVGFAAPVAAQTTVYNYGSGCGAPTTATASYTCTPSTGFTVTTQGWGATAGTNFVAANLSNQGGAGIGMTSASESTTAPQHAIDNDGKNEVVLLNFGTNRVVISDVQIGWLNTDSDMALYRWNGAATGPTMTSTAASHAGLIAAGWVLMADRDLDNNSAVLGDTGAQRWQYDNNASPTITNLVDGTGIAATTANASSWWLVAAYMGGGSQVLDTQSDYFKLLSLTTTCVSNSNTAPNAGGCANTSVPEPTSLALVGAALFGALRTTTRRRKAA